jgi:predicted SAM-dependent methyltransferase
MSYYSRWGFVIGSSWFQKYLRTAYERGENDLKFLSKKSPFSKPNFSCLLCGVGNKETARSFIQFAMSKNFRAKISIIDLGEEQIERVREMVKMDFPNGDITVKRMDALDLTKIFGKDSVDWIETDGFLEFFSKEKLGRLLDNWFAILRSDGFITIREPASSGNVGQMIDTLRVKVAKMWLGIDIYIHTRKELEDLIAKKKFEFVSFSSFVPTLRRFTLVKE